jgi:hypothetical protein
MDNGVFSWVVGFGSLSWRALDRCAVSTETNITRERSTSCHVIVESAEPGRHSYSSKRTPLQRRLTSHEVELNAAFSTTLADLRDADIDQVVGTLVSAAANEGHSRHWHTQTIAWRKQVAILKSAAEEVIRTKRDAATWGVILEYRIPRRARRIDAVVIAAGALVVLPSLAVRRALTMGANFGIKCLLA